MTSVQEKLDFKLLDNESNEQDNLITDVSDEKKPLTDDEKRLKSLNDYIERLKSSNDYSDSYNISLHEFEGPIDLLLHLIKAAKIRIEDIFVSKITEQYLLYMQQVSTLDLDSASDFIEVAAILIEIKAHSLLPKDDDVEEDNTAKRELIQKIEEYRLYKDASLQIKQREIVGAFFREPNGIGDAAPTILKDMHIDGLVNALQKLFLKLEQRPYKNVQRKIVLDRFTVAEKIAHVKDVLLVRDQVSFFELFDSDYSKSEIITTFQALLELLKTQYATARQEDIFGDIIIMKRDSFEDENPESNLMNEENY